MCLLYDNEFKGINVNSLMKATSLVAACGLVTALVAVNIGDDEITQGASTSSNEVQAEETFSDEDILAGLFYGTGEFAEALGVGLTTEDYAASGLDKSEYDAAVDFSIQEIKELYVEDVSAAMINLRSNDPLQVETGLDQLGDVADSYAEYYGVNQDDLGATSTPLCAVAVVCTLYAAVVAHNTVAVTALVVAGGGAVIALGAWFWVGAPSSAVMSKEIIVLDIMGALR